MVKERYTLTEPSHTVDTVTLSEKYPAMHKKIVQRANLPGMPHPTIADSQGLDYH